MRHDRDGWHAEFVGLSHSMGEHIDWDMRADDSKAQLWRMNLHYFEFLPDLTVETAQKLIIDWISASRPRNAISSSAGWTPYAISLRISAWLDYWSQHGPFGDASFQFLFSGSLREQTEYLAANLETDVRGNHLIKNIRSLAEMAAAYDDEAAAGWAKLADKHLKREVATQILPDGVHFERSISYHTQVFCDLMTIRSVRPADGFTPVLTDTLRKMAVSLQNLTHPDGKPVQFNDSGLDMCKAPYDALKAFYKNNSLPRADYSFAYSQAGFYGTRTKNIYCAVKMGPLGPDSLMAHAHGDWGSIEFSVGGQRIFVDQGVYEYVDGSDRQLSRSTYAHNTAVINGAEQASFFGAFRCGARPNVKPATFEDLRTGFILSGTIIPKGSTSKHQHKRTITFENEILKIHDSTNDPTVSVASHLLLHPDVQASCSDNIVRLKTLDGTYIEVSAPSPQTLELEKAEWFPNMGQRLPTLRIKSMGVGELRMDISQPAQPKK